VLVLEIALVLALVIVSAGWVSLVVAALRARGKHGAAGVELTRDYGFGRGSIWL
jgi:hypothetical protein